MVCNAGVIAIAPVTDMDFAEWRRVTEVNLHSVFLGSRAAARQMIRQGRGGVIINASSGAGRRGVPLDLLDLSPSEAGGIYRHKLVLSRPDQHVAWRGDAAPEDPTALVDLIRGAAPTQQASRTATA